MGRNFTAAGRFDPDHPRNSSGTADGRRERVPLLGVLIGQERKRHEIKLLLRGAHRLEVAVIKAPFGHVAVTKPAQCARRRRSEEPNNLFFSLPRFVRRDAMRNGRSEQSAKAGSRTTHGKGNHMKMKRGASRGICGFVPFALWRRDRGDATTTAREREHARRLAPRSARLRRPPGPNKVLLLPVGCNQG